MGKRAARPLKQVSMPWRKCWMRKVRAGAWGGLLLPRRVLLRAGGVGKYAFLHIIGVARVGVEYTAHGQVGAKYIATVCSSWSKQGVKRQILQTYSVPGGTDFFMPQPVLCNLG